VYLFDRYHKKTEVPFRLIKAIIRKNGEPIFFLTNTKDMTAAQVTDVYHRRRDIEVFFRFIKQELDFSNLVSYDKNGIKVMMYMILITSMMILVYKKVNKIKGCKISKLAFIDELQMGIVKEIVVACGGGQKKMKSMYDVE
jgi:IS4 transposase